MSGDEANDPDEVESVRSRHNPDGNKVLNHSAPKTDENNLINSFNSFAALSRTSPFTLYCVTTVSLSVFFPFLSSINHMHAFNNCFCFNNTTILLANSNSGLALLFAGMMTSKTIDVYNTGTANDWTASARRRDGE